MESIKITGAKVHNLKNVDVEIVRNKLTVITGPSGSGKSSLAFDTLYAEGQRRYVESLSSYARQFLGQMEPPDVESISGLSPAIAIDQKSTSKNPRSTVGTITEVYDYMRVLFARLGDAHCPETGELLESQSPQAIVDKLLDLKVKTKLMILAPVIVNQKGEHKELLGKYQSQGFARLRVNGQIVDFDDNYKLFKSKKNNVEIVIDRIVIKDEIKARLTGSIEQALSIGQGNIYVLIDEKEEFFSEHYFSKTSGKSYPPLEPRLFSFNSPLGACPVCNGLGVSRVFEQSKYIVDEALSIKKGAIPALGRRDGFYYSMVNSILKAEKLSEDTPITEWPKRIKKTIFEGSDKVYRFKFISDSAQYQFEKDFIGLNSWLDKKYHESSSERVREELEQYMEVRKCGECEGNRLNPYALSVTISEKSIIDISKMPIDEAFTFFKKLKFRGNKKLISEKVLKEINNRLKFLNDVGLNYLNLDRSANSLSGGESQRIRLATQIGSALSGVLYVLDEPSIGLHQRDNDKLIKTLRELRDIGNTVLVVEHDEDTMLSADYLIDIGPGAGVHGGSVVASGTPEQVQNQNSITGDFLSGKRMIQVPPTRRKIKDFIELKEVNEHNLKNISVNFPLNCLMCVTGVSGSGKSTLIHNALVKGVEDTLKSRSLSNRNYKSIKGADKLDSILKIDQTPIGRTPKSNPATYTKVLDLIRDLFASTNEAKVRGYKKGRFSFNVKGGRCEECEGNGSLKIEMNFLPDVFITCPRCQGKRFNDETLSIYFKGKNIADVLDLSIEEACEFFQNQPRISRILNTMNSIGLGYIKLGQPSTTLSGGEAQRMKLARELSKRPKGHCLYILDEPTTGLHFKDVEVLINAINKLVELGHSVLVIEHNLEVVKCADHIIDLGPEGGVLGGHIVAEGTPEEVSKNRKSITGKYLKKLLR